MTITRAFLLMLILSNAGWFGLSWYQSARLAAITHQAEQLYYENYANDHAAAECAVRTGYRYNCANGSQGVSCDH